MLALCSVFQDPPSRMTRPVQVSSRFFDRRANAYEQHAAIQTEVAERLLDRLAGLRFEPARILDVGCADARQCQALHQRFPKARIIGIDRSRGMLARGKARRRWWRRDFELLRADGGLLPLAADSVDLVYANLSLSWMSDMPAALHSWRRVLRPGGLALVSVFGPDTLAEQRPALPVPGLVLPDVQRFGALLVQAGFTEPVLDTDWITTVHPDRAALLNELRGSALLPARSAGLSRHANALKRYAAGPVENDGCRATWEIVSASAWAPEPGQPIRGASGEEVSVPVSAIGIRRRDN